MSKLQILFVQIARNISGAQYAQVQDSCDGEGEKGDGGGGRGEEQEARQESFNIKKNIKRHKKYKKCKKFYISSMNWLI